MSVAVVTLCLLLQCVTHKSPPFVDMGMMGCYQIAISWCAQVFPDYEIKDIRCERYKEHQEKRRA